MAFQKKTWTDRQTQHPNKRTLTPVSGENNAYTVARAEGDVFEEGDKFDAENMNGLENRIETGFSEMSNSLSNPNILINSNLCNSVNQLVVIPSTWTDFYGLDMWYNYGKKSKITGISANGLSFSGSGGSGMEGILQYIEIYKIDTAKKHVVSCNIGGTVYTFDGITFLTQQSKDFDTFSIITGFDANHGYYVCIKCKSSTTPITLKWVKLEQSEFATPYQIPDYSDEFLKCCRYFEVVYTTYANYGPANVDCYNVYNFKTIKYKDPAITSNIQGIAGCTVMNSADTKYITQQLKITSTGSFAIYGNVYADARL